MSFLTVCPRDKSYLRYNVEGVSLRVINDNGVEVKPDVDFKVNTLNNSNRQIVNNSGNGNVFNIDILLFTDDSFMGNYDEWVEDQIIDSGDLGNIILMRHDYHNDSIPVIKALDYWIRNGVPLYVTTDAIDIPDDLYIVTANSKRKQTYEKSTVWSLEFTKYDDLNNSIFLNNNAKVTAAIAKYNKKKSDTKKANEKKASQSESLKNKFKKCDYKTLVYSKKKKTVTCVKYMQEILYKGGFYPKTTVNQIDGWYGNMTTQAVKNFQKKYKTKYKLSVTGKVDKKTFEAIYTV